MLTWLPTQLNLAKSKLKHPINGLITRRKSMRKTAGIIAAVALAASALFAAPAHAAGSITAGGSSFSAGMFTTCAAGSDVTYTSSSSGTGKTNFSNGQFDFAGSDAVYAATETKPKGSFTYVPVLGGPIAIIFNVPGVRNLRLDAVTIGKIFQGTISKWNDKAIAKLNKGVKLPAQAIIPEYRNSKSGTNGNFSGYLAANKAAGWTADQTWTVATGKATPAGTGAATSTLVVSNVKNNTYSIGYVDLKDAMSSNVNYASVKNAAGQFIKPTPAASAKFLAKQSVSADGSVAINWAQKVPGGYNASLITYAIVNTSDSKNGSGVKSFLTTMLDSCVPAHASALGYVQLTGALLAKAKSQVALIK
jgi:phosphate transport system substrate-binding protein